MNDAIRQAVPWYVSVRRVMALALLLGALLGAYHIREFTKSRRSAAADPLGIDASRLDFGLVWEDEAFHWKLPVRNQSNSRLHVEGFHLQCGCAALEPTSFVLDPGKETDVTLRLDLTSDALYREETNDGGSGSLTEARRERAVGVAIRPQVLGPQGGQLEQAPWLLRGRVRPALRSNPARVFFTDTLVQGEPFPSQRVRIETHVPTTSITVTCEPEHADVAIERTSGDSPSYDVMIKPKASLPLGEFTFNVFLQIHAKTQELLPRSRIPVRGSVLADIHATPATLVLGVRGLGQTVRETLVLRSRTGKQFSVDRVVADSPDTKIEALSTDPLVKEYQVSQHIASPDDVTQQIAFHVRQGAKDPLVVLLVPVVYHGVAD